MHPVLFLALLAQWTPIGPWGGPAGYLSVDRKNPDRVIACSRNGNVFLSTSAGKQWTRLSFPRLAGASIEVLKIHPQKPETFFAGVSDETGESAGIYESADGGKTWERNKSMKGEAVFSLTFFPADPGIVAAGTRRGVFLSRDDGKRWKALTADGEPSPRPVMSMAFDPKDSNLLYAGTTHLPWKTTDGGSSWKSIHEGMLDDSDVFSLHVDSQNPQRIYASACSGIYASDAQGEPWRKAQGIPGTDRRTHVIIADPEFSSLLLAGTTAGLWKSSDAGSTWRKLNDYVIRSLEYNPNDSRVLYMATADRGLMKSATAGIEFSEINEGYAGRPMVRLLFPGGAADLIALALRTDGSAGIFHSMVGGGTWKLEESRGVGVNDAVLFREALYARTSRGVFRRESDGEWNPVHLPGNAAVLVLESTGSTLWAGTRSGLLRTSDGLKWTPVAVPEAKASVYELFVTGRSALVRTGKSLWLSTDLGAKWTPVSDPGNGRLFDIALHPRDGQIIFSATSSGLMKSIDQGRNWVRVAGGLPDGFLYSISAHPARQGEWYTVQMGTTFRSRDDGNTWEELAGRIENVLVKRLYINSAQPERLYALTEGQGILTRRILP